MFYYAERKTVENGVPKTTTVYKTGERTAMERQFYLFCASAVTNESGADLEVCEWGTLENGKIDRKVYYKPAPEPQPEPEPEPTPEDETTPE